MFIKVTVRVYTKDFENYDRYININSIQSYQSKGGGAFMEFRDDSVVTVVDTPEEIDHKIRIALASVGT